MFFGKGALKICSNITEEHPCRNVIPIKNQSNFIETTHRQGCSHVNLQYILRTYFPKNTSGDLTTVLLEILNFKIWKFNNNLITLIILKAIES